MGSKQSSGGSTKYGFDTDQALSPDYNGPIVVYDISVVHKPSITDWIAPEFAIQQPSRRERRMFRTIAERGIPIVYSAVALPRDYVRGYLRRMPRGALFTPASKDGIILMTPSRTLQFKTDLFAALRTAYPNARLTCIGPDIPPNGAVFAKNCHGSHWQKSLIFGTKSTLGPNDSEFYRFGVKNVAAVLAQLPVQPSRPRGFVTLPGWPLETAGRIAVE